MNAIMRDAFSRLDHYMFYTAFAQLISRITHPNEEVFNTLKVCAFQLSSFSNFISHIEYGFYLRSSHISLQRERVVRGVFF